MLQAAPVAEVISYDQSGLKASDARIHEAIKQAAQMRKWGIVSDKPGKVLLVYPTNNRSLHYQATVSVTYGKGSYKVEYVKSRGLDEKRNGCYGKEGVVCAPQRQSLDCQSWQGSQSHPESELLTGLREKTAS